MPRVWQLLVLLGVVVVVGAQSDKLTIASSLPKDEYIQLEVLRDLSDYTENGRHVILFQSPESVLVEGDENPLIHTPSVHNDRARTKPQSTNKDMATEALSQDRANQDSWIRLIREKDPNNKLYNKYGFNYLGRVSLILPDFHVLVSETEEKHDEGDDESLEDYLRRVFGATWISSTQTHKQLRPLRRASKTVTNTDSDSSLSETAVRRQTRRDVRETRRSRKLLHHSEARRKTVVGQFMEEDREERKARKEKRKRLAQADNENAAIVGENVRQSALRRTALKTIHPDGPIGRGVTAPWTSRRLQSLEEDLRYSYQRTQFPSDPMVKDQWYIHGGYYENKMRRHRVIPIPEGAFLDVMPLWESPHRIDGRGVVLAMVDNGVNFIHSDLKDKAVPMLSIDLAESVWVAPDEPNRDEIIDEIRRQTRHGLPRVGQSHGTSMASIAAGSPSDGTCGTGVAPGAMVSSIRVIGLNEMDGSGVGTTGNMLSPIQEALALSHRCVHVDTSSGSRRLENMIYVVGWGPQTITNQTPIAVPYMVQSAIEGCIEYGRNNLGSIYIFPSGNDRQVGDSIDFDGYASMRHAISVGSVSPTGYPLYYSEGGESLMLSTPSGDTKGRGITAATTKGSFFDSRMKTLDTFSGTPHGDIARSVRDSLAAEEGSARTSLGATGCTSKFTGTSASASMIGGVVSMMLQANPSLTWKDVQDILIRSCDALHYGETLHPSGQTHDRMYRDVLPIRLAQDRNDNMYSHFQPAVSSPGTKPKEHDEEEMSDTELRGMEILNLIKSSLYIFYSSTDPMEWISNRETGLHHSRRMGFGVPNVATLIDMSQKRGREDGTPSIDNDYSLTTANLVDTNAVHYAFGARDSMGGPAQAKEDTFIQGAKEGSYYQQEARGGIVRPQETAAWHVQFDPEKDRVHQIHDSRRANRDGLGERQSENFVMERVELTINATMPMGISNTQIAMCDRSALCSLFIPGLPYEKTKADSQQLEYTFSTVRYWGQHNPYDGAWVILLRNVYPTRSSAVEIDHLSIAVYGHYV